MSFEPSLTTTTVDGMSLLVDPSARELGVVVGFSDRRGGASVAPWDSLNLSSAVGDDDDAVRANRERVARALGRDSLGVARQIHGADVLRLEAGASGALGEGDVLVATDSRVTPTILTADCVPILLAGDGVVAAAHAGWRGLVAGAIETAIAQVGEVTAAWVGPSIRGCCYEVGTEVIERFEGAGLPVQDDSHVDPGRAARAILSRSGVGSVAVSDDCTHCNENYFSFRRDGVTGRQGSFIGLLGG